jgi:hypothetical protein
VAIEEYAKQFLKTLRQNEEPNGLKAERQALCHLIVTYTQRIWTLFPALLFSQDYQALMLLGS